ncbi:NAD-dependent epimerase/dehydratase family protein [Paenalcaligenes sp. Me52]|uniref:NAD-dependent epimerase/dehydratase family protein n=1 Tax=Paenalcaligenes sp. Me52 TaxID=3392038 RepID=UPI003D2A1E96
MTQPSSFPTVLVTGATSGLGRNAALWLQQAGYTVIGLGRDQQAGAELAKQGVRFVACDLSTVEPTILQALVQQVDWVWHCAALSAPWGDKQAFMAANVVATQALAQAAGQAGVQRFVHISTPSLYFDFQNRQQIPESFVAHRFANMYAQTKFMAEGCIQQAQQQYPETRFTMLRPRGIFGPYDRVIVPRLQEQLARFNGVLKLPRGGEAYVDLTFALNVVHAMQLASTQPNLPPAAVYNISNQESIVLREVIDTLFRQELGHDIRIQAVPYHVLYAVATGMEAVAKITGKEPMLTRYSVGALSFDMTLCPRKAQQELGYYPLYSMQQSIALTAQWLRQQQR